MGGLVTLCILCLALCLLFLIAWTTYELPRAIIHAVEFWKYHKTHRFYHEVKKNFWLIFYPHV